MDGNWKHWYFKCQCQSNIYIAPKIEGRISGAGVWVTRRNR